MRCEEGVKCGACGEVCGIMHGVHGYMCVVCGEEMTINRSCNYVR